MAVALGSAVGTLGTVLFYGTATVNLVWQHMGWKWLEKGDFKKLYLVDMVFPVDFPPSLLLHPHLYHLQGRRQYG